MSSNFHFIYILCVVELLAGVALATCPSSCQCLSNSVNCVNKNLDNVPNFANLETTPVIIDLSGNNIQTVTVSDFSFDLNENVTEIYLNHSKLVAIEPNSFDELTNLQELYLGDNYMTEIHEDLFIRNEQIILLDLSENYFETFPRINSSSLELLLIQKNRLNRMDNGVLDALPNLRMLFLQDNNLKIVDPVIFANLHFVRVEFNPWQCNCKTVKLFQYFLSKELLDTEITIQCYTDDKRAIDMFDEDGLTDIFQENCFNSEEKNAELVKILAIREEKLNTNQRNSTKNQKDDEEYVVSYVYFLMLSSALWIGFTVGAVFGSYITYSRMKGAIVGSTSTKKLLCEDI